MYTMSTHVKQNAYNVYTCKSKNNIWPLYGNNEFVVDWMPTHEPGDSSLFAHT